MYWCIHDLWSPTNLVASMVRRVGLYPTIPPGCTRDSVWATHGCPSSISWKTCTRVRWTQLDSLIVVVNYYHSWCLCDLCLSCCQVVTLARFKLAQVTATLLDMSDSCLLLSFRSNSTFIGLYLYRKMDVDYLVVDEVLNINVDWSQLHV
jgi:hypothetical protein